MILYDTGVFRFGATQQWNDQWRTWGYIAKHDYNAVVDFDALQWAIGVSHQYNDSIGFGLDYINVNWDAESGLADENKVKFTTQIDF